MCCASSPCYCGLWATSRAVLVIAARIPLLFWAACVGDVIACKVSTLSALSSLFGCMVKSTGWLHGEVSRAAVVGVATAELRALGVCAHS